MSRAEANGRNLGQEARVVMHEDERAIVKEILGKALGDDDCFVKVVSGERSESGRAADRLVLARFFERMERQFALRAARMEGRLAPGARPDLERSSVGELPRMGQSHGAKRGEAA